MAHAPTTLGDIASALSVLDPEPRDSWIELGMACHEFDQGHECFTVWDRWSAGASCYSEKECQYQWRKFKEGGNGRKKTVGSLFFAAQQKGWRKNGVAHKPSTNQDLKAVQNAQPPSPEPEFQKEEREPESKKLWPTVEDALQAMDGMLAAGGDVDALTMLGSDYGLDDLSTPSSWGVLDHPDMGPGIVYVGNTVAGQLFVKFKTFARYVDNKERMKRRQTVLHSTKDSGPAALVMLRPGKPLVIAGGEEKAAAAWGAGYAALGPMNGELAVGDWPQYVSQKIKPHKIILAHDADDQGRKAIAAWSESLIAAGVDPTTIYAVQWGEDRADGYDLNDALKAGELERILEGAVCEARKGLSILYPSEMFATQLPENDAILADRLLSLGGSMSIIGPGGIGKSRLVVQMLISIILGREWLGIQTFKPDARVLVFQTENSLRRMTSDMAAALRGMGEHDRDRVNRCFAMLAPLTDDDCYLNVSNSAVLANLTKAVRTYRPDIVVVDPLGEFFGGDNSNDDNQMRETFRALKKMSQIQNRDTALIIVHHARTGKVAAAGALGYESSNYGKGSKALHSCVRSQLNIAPGTEDDAGSIIVACGKNNDGPRFEAFGVRLNSDSMQYEMDLGLDVAAWREAIEKKTPKGRPKSIKMSIVDIIKASGRASMRRFELIDLIMRANACSNSTAVRLIRVAFEGEEIANTGEFYHLPR